MTETTCLVCNKLLIGRQVKYCSRLCRVRQWQSRQKRRVRPQTVLIGITYDDIKHKVQRATKAVYNAVRFCELTPAPCEICGRSWGTVAHHQDYDKPLKVNWLCPSCHLLVHSAVRIILRCAS